MAKLLDEVKVLAKLSEAEVQKIHAALDAWFIKHFHGNRIAQDTDSYNICHAAKEDLKAILTPAPAAAAKSDATE